MLNLICVLWYVLKDSNGVYPELVSATESSRGSMKRGGGSLGDKICWVFVTLFMSLTGKYKKGETKGSDRLVCGKPELLKQLGITW